MAKKVLSLASPPELLQLSVGDTCRIKVYFDYVGHQTSAALYVAIGRVGVVGFDEIVSKSKSIIIPEAITTRTYQADVDIYISSAMTLAPGYDLYAKIIGLPGPDIYSPTCENVIEIIEAAPPAVLSIRLKNPPAGSEIWAINIDSNDRKATRSSPKMRLGGMVVWEDLSLYWFPIYVSAVVAKEDLTILWQVTSYPELDWTPFYNPDAVIPGFGDYYLNCATGLFEKI